MKTVTKALVAAVGLALGAQAQAAIDTDDAINLGNGTGAGELFLSVIDRGGSTPRSYVLDLGITASDFLANDATFVNNISINADANLVNLLTNVTGTISWNIAAASNSFLSPGFDSFGYLTTSPSDPIANFNTGSGIAGLSNGLLQIGQYITEVNATLGSPANTNYAADVSVLINSPASNAFYDGPFWGDGWTLASMSTEGGLGDDLGFYYIAVDANDPLATSSTVEELLGQWSLAANGTLTYTNDVGAPVPVPAAVWLLGSALVGLVGVARRKNEQV